MATIVIGCKLPNGLHLDYAGKRVTLNGANSSSIIGGHGITTGVDKEFWEAWSKLHADFVPIQKGLIFAHDKESSANAQAKEYSKNVSGFEGLDPNKPAAGIAPASTEA